MLTKSELEKYLEKCLSTGASFAELFLEESTSTIIKLSDQQVQKKTTNILKGVGIRICQGEKVVYASTNKLEKIPQLITRLISNFSTTPEVKKINLSQKHEHFDKIKIPHHQYPIEKKKELLYKIDNTARSVSPKINQVEATILEKNQKITIANSNLLYTEDNRTSTRLSVTIYAKEAEKLEKSHLAPGFKTGYEFLETFPLETEIINTAQQALEKLTAIECPCGELPVVIGNGFGGVIFHEACVHALEATTVAKGSSVFNNKLNKQIASSKVTIIDDGTITNEWGSFTIDDEGAKSQQNILIKDGILTNYLIDYQNSIVMNSSPTSSGRRQSYQYAPTSRMSNTYLAPGTDNITDMIQSIDYGLYAKNMGGGSVDPKTGDFNFSVNDAYLIENGQITKPVKGASLIGNGANVIKQVSMISDDLKLTAGMCGSTSGNIPVTVGQPTIKVDKILVGGRGEKYHG